MAGRRGFRGMRVPVEALFENLADSLSLDETLDGPETLDRDDAVAVLDVAARAVARPKAV
ncbi:DUF433 domain-containing protein [Methylobacterium sp. 17Sr1-1]|uniref:DUF433 domain-containing protein n=1 Tax=Methylobacterium sp. 17Sr1-1 TaxID=2202826 RepID=UPI000D70421D|nr:DUF433 domain-containing protein [Methylobacterium sp. 17Sr1-1]AWN54564.1 DUF433 domain-containing protein [Methylobacterium sp. 17Sr1-1]